MANYDGSPTAFSRGLLLATIQLLVFDEVKYIEGEGCVIICEQI